MNKRIVTGAVLIAVILGALPLMTLAQGFVEDAVFPHETQCFSLSSYETFCRITDTETGHVCYLYRGGFEAGGSVSCVP